MYSYYALVSMGKYPPKMFAMTITVLQLTQMIVGFAVNIWAHNYMLTAPPHTCGISKINIKLSMAMYFSYLILFAQFFYKAYLAPKPTKKERKDKMEPIDIPSKQNEYTINSNGNLRQRNGVVH